MRISTNMIFDAGVSTINRQTAALLHLQQQVSSGRRLLTPADDPVAAARILEVQQAADVNSQFSVNHNNVKSALGLEEAQLQSMTDIFGRIRELTVQAGNDTLSANDRKSTAQELRARFEELVGLANTTDGAGQYLFSGYMGSTKPFGGSVDAMLAAPASEITYMGDSGQRELQVSASRFLAVSDAGNDVFMNIKSGNGYFATDYANSNTGTGIIDAGNVTDPATWNALANKNFRIDFTVDTSVVPSVTRYDLIDTASGNSLLTGAPGPAPLANQRVYYDNQPILLKNQGGEPPFDLGGSVTISGAPATGDQFTLQPSGNQSLFRTLANLIGTLENGASGSAAQAKFANDIGQALTNLDQAHDNILKVRAEVGSRLHEIDTLADVNADLKLQYQQTISDLGDLDYAKAISDLTRKQTDLEAAQKSFVSTSRLSLFNYL